jgi:hypothetical protein
MSLTFDDRGLLPPGIHDATLDEVEQAFARFQRTDRRIKLFEKLRAYVAELRKTGWTYTLLIDGSFVMPPVDAPNDIDAILVFPAAWDMEQQLRPFQYNLVSKRVTKKDYNIEVYPVPAGSADEQEFLDLFARVRVEWSEQFGWPNQSFKGVVRILP